VLVLGLPVLKRAVVGWHFWWYGPTFRQMTFVMDEFKPNEGSPYILGHFEGESDPWGMVGRDLGGGRQVVDAMPSIAFAPGATVPVWYSPAAPLTIYFGEEANIFPVAARPVLPGAGMFFGWLLAEFGIFVAAVGLTGVVYRRFSYVSGTLPMKRSSVVPLMNQLHNVRLIAAAYTEAWCRHDAPAVARYYTEGGTLAINGGAPAKGRAAIAAAAQSFMTTFPDLVVTFDNLVERGDRFVYSWTLTGTNTGPGGSGRQVKISGTETWDLDEDGKIVASVGHFDQADHDRQISLGESARW